MHIHEPQLNSLFMASSIFPASPILLLILFHSLLQHHRTCHASNSTEKTHPGLRLTLTRVDLAKNLPKKQFSSNSMIDHENDWSLKSGAQASNDLYITNIQIRTPPVTFSAVMDTGSDLIWTKCQSSPRFYDSSKSKSYFKSEESCVSYGCKQDYADGESISVIMGRETLAMGGVISSNLTFACGTPNDKKSFKNYDGVVGMGRGKLSLVSQLKLSVFSYCLASRNHKSEESVLLIGSMATTQTIMTNVQTTPLLTQGDPSYYYVSLEGISVGETRLLVSKSDLEIQEDKTGGMIIDSGTTFTYLDEGIIDMIEDEFMKQTKLNKSEVEATLYDGLTRCFDQYPKESKIIPKLVFHFSGANWDLPPENYIYEKEGKACLAFIANDKKDKLKVSIFGNMQQQNMVVLYDLDNNRLKFKPAKCNQL